MAEDIRIILEKANALNLPLSESLIKQVGTGLAISHLAGEIIRGLTYISITWVICQTVLLVLKP